MYDLENWVKKHGKKTHVTKNRVVFQIGERPTHLYYLECGWIKISQETESGQTITLSLRKAGDLFGLAEILAYDTVRARYAYSLTDCTFYMISVEQLQLVLKEEPELWQYFSQLMAQRLIEMQHFIRALTTLQAPERLGWLLQQFAQQNGKTYIVELPLTHEEISFLIGCSRQKVTSYLNAWRKEGSILYERGRIDVLESAKVFPR